MLPLFKQSFALAVLCGANVGIQWAALSFRSFRPRLNHPVQLSGAPVASMRSACPSLRPHPVRARYSLNDGLIQVQSSRLWSFICVLVDTLKLCLDEASEQASLHVCVLGCEHDVPI